MGGWHIQRSQSSLLPRGHDCFISISLGTFSWACLVCVSLLSSVYSKLQGQSEEQLCACCLGPRTEAFSLGTQTLVPAAKNQQKLVGLVKAREHRITSMSWYTFSPTPVRVPSHLRMVTTRLGRALGPEGARLGRKHTSSRVRHCGMGSSGGQCLWT